MKRQISFALSALLLFAVAAEATRYPLFGGPGLIHLQSAKAGIGYGYRSLGALASYSGQNFYGHSGKQDGLLDAWSYNTVYYAPLKNLAVMGAGIAHGEQWSIAVPDTTPEDNMLACPGDAVLALKYQLPLMEGRLDLGFMPVVTIPMDRNKYADRASQTGKLDFGAKVLGDVNLGQTVVFVNAGYLTRGDERPQVPFGVGAEYSINKNISAFFETSGEYRLGGAKDSIPDDLILRGRGEDRTELRVTPGIRYSPLPFLGINLACDIGLTQASAPWQLILGLDIPAAAGKAVAGIMEGAVAGRIKDRETGVPMKGMITFPGTSLPGLVSNEAGNYEAKLPPGEYKVHIYANGYRWIERKVNVKEGKVEKWDLTLKRKTAIFKGRVTDQSTGQPMSATVSFNSSRVADINTDPTTGLFSTIVPSGKYKITVEIPGYQPYSEEINLKDKSENERQVSLAKPLAVAAVSASGRRTKEPPLVAQEKPKTEPQVALVPAAQAAPPPAPQPQSSRPKAEPKPKPAASAPAAPKAPKMSAEEVTALYKKGVQQFMNEEYAQAEKTFKQVLAADPGHAKAKEYLGKTRDRLKKGK
jgi:hypothetical protein